MIQETQCLIVGSGPAGYTAAIYAARADMKPLMYEGLQPGGQLTTTNEVENFPGYPHGVSGPEMMVQLKEQALRFETDIRSGFITKVDFSGDVHKCWADDGTEIHAKTVIIATGASAKYIGLESEQKYLQTGGGVSACAVCDGFFYRGQETVAKIYNLGNPPRRLVLLHLDGSVVTSPAQGTDVMNGEVKVGFLGTVARHHELGTIALAVIKRNTPVDAELTVDGVPAIQQIIVPA